MRVAECDEPEAGEHRDTGICTLALLHEVADGCENVLFVDTELARLLQVISEDIEEKLGVGRSVDVTVGSLVHELQKLRRVDEVAILYQWFESEWKVRSLRYTYVCEDDAIRRVHVERLSLRVVGTSSGGVSHLREISVYIFRGPRNSP